MSPIKENEREHTTSCFNEVILATLLFSCLIMIMELGLLGHLGLNKIKSENFTHKNWSWSKAGAC